MSAYQNANFLPLNYNNGVLWFPGGNVSLIDYNSVGGSGGTYTVNAKVPYPNLGGGAVISDGNNNYNVTGNGSNSSFNTSSTWITVAIFPGQNIVPSGNYVFTPSIFPGILFSFNGDANGASGSFVINLTAENCYRSIETIPARDPLSNKDKMVIYGGIFAVFVFSLVIALFVFIYHNEYQGAAIIAIILLLFILYLSL